MIVEISETYSCEIKCSVISAISASFTFYFLVLGTWSRTSAMVSFNIETLNSGANPSL